MKYTEHCRPGNRRRWRVSVFASAEAVYVDILCICRASRSWRRAWSWFMHFQQQCRVGVYAYVVMHQGNLSRSSSAWTQADSRWS